VPRREKYVPKHRNAPAEPALKKGLRKTVVFSGVAVAATGVAVGSGIALDQPSVAAGTSASLASASLSRSDASVRHQPDHQPDASASTSISSLTALRARLDTTSRSAPRPPLDPTKTATLDQESGGQVTHTEDLSSQDPRDIARALLPQYGFSESEFTCLDELYTKESGWNVHADNPTSDAYGIPQALPGSKMASAGADWANDAATQIKWGLEYIRSSYGTPCGAWSHELAYNWY
jgi:hypothetical protein